MQLDDSQRDKAVDSSTKNFITQSLCAAGVTERTPPPQRVTCRFSACVCVCARGCSIQSENVSRTFQLVFHIFHEPTHAQIHRSRIKHHKTRFVSMRDLPFIFLPLLSFFFASHCFFLAIQSLVIYNWVVRGNF